MNFLDRIYFDNTVEAYLIIAGILFLSFLLKKYLSRYVAALLYKIIHRFWKSVSKESFVDLVVEPLEWFILIVITVLSIDKLTFPNALKFTFYHVNTQSFIDGLGMAIVICTFIWLLMRIIDFIALVLEHTARISLDKADDQLVVFFRDLLKVVLGIIGILLLLKFCFNQDIGNLLTGLSIVGAALALAARESLENIIASFIIFFDKPFITGDFVKVQQITGTVEKIGLRSTRIRTGDKTLVSVPNKQMVDSIVDNITMRTLRRAEIKIELATDTPADKIKIFIDESRKLLTANAPQVVSSTVFLKNISKAGMMIVIEYFTSPIELPEFDKLKEKISLEVMAYLEQNEMHFAVNPGGEPV